jgi:hypothetical protein
VFALDLMSTYEREHRIFEEAVFQHHNDEAKKTTINK